MNIKYHNLLNSVKYQQLREDVEGLRQSFRIYASMQFNAGLVDLYNKTFQLNDMGFLKYIETQLAQKHFVGVISQL